MKTTVDIPENLLDEAMRRAGTSDPNQAIIEALKAYTRTHNQRDLIKYLGTFKDFMTHKELMDMRLERGKYRCSR